MALLLLPLLLLLAPLPPSASRPGPTEVTVGAMVPEDPRRSPWAWPRVGAALSLALESALQPQLSPASLAVRPVLVPAQDVLDGGFCNIEEAKLKAIDVRLSLHPDLLLFGSDCELDVVARFAQHWRLPVLTVGPGSVNLAAGGSSTTAHSYPWGRQLKVLASRLLEHLDGTSRALFLFTVDARGLLLYQVMAPFSQWLPANSSFTTHNHFYSYVDQTIEDIRAPEKGSLSVIFIIGSLENLQEMMHLAQVQKMTDGDYIFIYLDLFGESLEGHQEAVKPWQSKEGQDAGGLREAFQTVLVVTPHEPQTSEYWHFQSQLILRAQSDFGVALNDSLLERLVAGCFHDALLLYMRALNETLHEGGTKRNTSRILEKMRDLKIQGVTGMVSMEGNIVRQADFDLWSMADVESGEFQVVGQYKGSEKQINWLAPFYWKNVSRSLDMPPYVKFKGTFPGSKPH